jgi:hypothetical protein
MARRFGSIIGSKLACHRQIGAEVQFQEGAELMGLAGEVAASIDLKCCRNTRDAPDDVKTRDALRRFRSMASAEVQVEGGAFGCFTDE